VATPVGICKISCKYFKSLKKKKKLYGKMGQFYIYNEGNMAIFENINKG
jgi:hypothetical protein